jgi:amino acid adenylation domain-containing protein
MDSAIEFLNSLASKGIKLSASSGRLECYAQKGTLTEEIRDGIVKHKAGIIALFEARKRRPQPQTGSGLLRGAREYPLSAGQKGLYILHQLHPGLSAYNVPICLKVNTEVNTEALAQAWALLLEQFPILTARVIEKNGDLYHLLDDACKTAIQEHEINFADEQHLLSFLQKRAKEPFDLHRGPLTRIEVFIQDGRKSAILLVIHHIVFDGTSSMILLRSLVQFYQQCSLGRPVRLSQDLPGYQEFVAAEEAMLTSEEGAAHARYWQKQLQGDLPNVEILPDLPRPASRSFQGKRLVEDLPEALGRHVRDFSTTHSLRPAAIFLAVFQLLLHRHTRQDDIIVGMPVTTRLEHRFRSEIGYFINMIPVRARCEESMKLGDFLRAIQNAMLDGIYHSRYPFPLMLEKLKLKQTEKNPVFQVAYAYQNFAKADVYTALSPRQGLYLEDIGQEGDFDLGLEIFERETSFSAHLKYNPELYSEDTARRLIDGYCMLLKAIGENPDRQLQDYSVLPEEERSRVLVQFNNTSADYPQDKCIHDLFFEQVQDHPDTRVLICGEHELSYQELYFKSRDLALYLQSQGVKPDSVVGLCVERSLDMIVGLLGILQAGGAYVPLDSDYPDERLAYMLQDSQAAIVLTQDRLKGRLSGLVPAETQLISLDGQEQEIGDRVAELKEHGATLHSEVKPHHLAYVIYTSGSTGNPKGVMVEHRSLVNHNRFARSQYQITKDDIQVQFSSISFDLFVEELFVILNSGAQLVIEQKDKLLIPQSLKQVTDRHNVTTLNVPTAFFHELIASRFDFTGIRNIIVGGEVLTHSKAQALVDEFPNVRLHNTYGPTEATIISTAVCVTKQILRQHGSVPIGVPIDNTQIYILDEKNGPQPIGIPGELHIAGDGLARGYLNRPELTVEKFVANPFRPGTRMYKTGDLARWLDDGNIQYLGRIDTQVKIRGFRIELEEIESRLSQHAGIEDSVVIARGEDGNKQLIAFYRAKETRADHLVQLSNEELRGQLLRTLPEYMAPAAFVSLAAIPVNANGKVDRRALEKMEVAVGSWREYVEPENDLERQVVEIWAEVLKLAPDKIGTNDNFFELGGHSLLATQVTAKIRSRMDIDLPLKALFEQGSVSQLARFIAQAANNTIPPIRPVDRAQLERLPLSFAQERLWFIHQLDPGSAGYNIPGAVIIHGELNVGQLEEALNLVIARHENLRTVFPSQDGQAQQRILDKLDFRLERIDLSHYPNIDEKQRVAKEICHQEAAGHFDLANGPLLRGKVIQLSEQEHILLLNMHHIISDGWSIAILIRELSLIIEALRQGRHPDLSPLPIQYADYAVWQRRVLEEGEVIKEQLAYWQKKLAGAPDSLDLATDYPRPSVQTFAGAAYRFTLDAKLTAKLKRLAQQKSGTLYMVLLAAFKVLLHRYTGQNDICVGTPIANRQYGETQGLVGMFVNTLALRSQVEAEDTFSALLSQIRATCLEAYEHQDAPFEKVVDMLEIQRNLAVSPLFQAMFLLQNTSGETLEPGFQPYPLETGVAKFDLSLEFAETEEGLAGSIEYRTALYKAETIARMAAHFTALCQAITATPAAKICNLECLAEGEKHQLLVAYNDTRSDYPRDKCIHDFFIEQVRDNPGRKAVRFGDQELSYQELHERSDALALYLQSLGVKSDSVVGLCVERSLEMMVGIMAIVRAGGAYLPVDPAYPDDRVEYMLQDSQAAVVLTQERLRNKVKSLLLGDVKLVSLDKEWPDISRSAAALQASGAELRREVQPQNLAYLIYTSGSTGKPKGVLVEHQALVNRLHWMQDCYRLTADDVVLQKTPYSFDVSVWEFFWPLMTGASLVFADPEGHKDVGYLESLIQRAKVTTLHFVPSMLRVFLENARGSCGCVRQIFCSGEALDKRSVDDYRTRFPEAALHNLYGPTEAAIDVTAYDCSQLSYPFVPIGKPIANTQIHILNAHQHLQPIGVPGELHIAGDNLARGYLNRPELTKEKFVANPFQPGTRMYKTGDLARWLDDGNIQYLCRMDTQLKIRGVRIELGEIEASLNQYPEIQDCAVVAQGPEGDKQLIAFYSTKTRVSGEPVQLPAEALRAHLAQTLPEYMIPAAFVSLLAIPLSSNGKADRRALVSKQFKISSGRPYVPPRTDLERQLVEIWAGVLNLPPAKIGINDSFFELGGHSLSAVQLIARMSRRLSQSLPLAFLFRASNIAALAKLISTKTITSGDILVPIQTNGNALPVFGLPGADGHAWSLRSLSRILGPDQPFYGLQSAGSDGKTPPLSTVEQTALANLSAIKAVQSKGPYRLIGFSYGGVVAYEMARILLEQGEHISSLVLLDSLAPAVMRQHSPADEAAELFQACTMAANLSGVHLEIDAERFRQSSIEENSQYVLGFLNARGFEITAEQLKALHDIYRANLLSYSAYQPLKLIRHVDVSLYRATQNQQNAAPMPRDYGWNELLLKPVHVYDVEGDHFSFIKKLDPQGLTEALKLETSSGADPLLAAMTPTSAGHMLDSAEVAPIER